MVPLRRAVVGELVGPFHVEGLGVEPRSDPSKVLDVRRRDLHRPVPLRILGVERVVREGDHGLPLHPLRFESLRLLCRDHPALHRAVEAFGDGGVWIRRHRDGGEFQQLLFRVPPALAHDRSLSPLCDRLPVLADLLVHPLVRHEPHARRPQEPSPVQPVDRVGERIRLRIRELDLELQLSVARLHRNRLPHGGREVVVRPQEDRVALEVRQIPAGHADHLAMPVLGLVGPDEPQSPWLARDLFDLEGEPPQEGEATLRLAVVVERAEDLVPAPGAPFGLGCYRILHPFLPYAATATQRQFTTSRAGPPASAG